MSTGRLKDWEWKWEGKGFPQPNHLAASIVLVASNTLKPYTHSAAATDKCPQHSHFHMKAETEQKAIPAVCACSSPAVDSGSGCIHQQSRGKASAARTWNVAVLPAFWSREMRICLCLSLHHPCSSPTPTMEWGKSSHWSTRALSAQTRAHALFWICVWMYEWWSYAMKYVPFISMYVALLTYYSTARVLV